MSTSSKPLPLTWKRLHEAAARLDDRSYTKEHADAVFWHQLRCAVQSLQAKREQAERPPRRVLLVKSTPAAKGRAAPAPARPAQRMMTDAEIEQAVRRLARL